MTQTDTFSELGADMAPGVAGESLADQAYRCLHRSLMTGGLLPEQVITVRGLAETYGMSLTPARDAIQRLVSEGALVIENARTIKVPRLGVETYREILQVRLELEPMAARDAAPLMSNAEMDRIDNIVAVHLAAIKANQAHKTLTANTDFHMSIYRACQKPVLVGIIERLNLRVGPTLNMLFPKYCGSLVGHESHLCAADALRRRDGDALAEAIKGDLTEGSRYLLKMLKP